MWPFQKVKEGEGRPQLVLGLRAGWGGLVGPASPGSVPAPACTCREGLQEARRLQELGRAADPQGLGPAEGERAVSCVCTPRRGT